MKKIILLLIFTHSMFFYIGMKTDLHEIKNTNKVDILTKNTTPKKQEIAHIENKLNTEKPNFLTNNINYNFTKNYNFENLIDIKIVNNIIKKLNSKDQSEKMSAISFLAEYGNSESKKIIKNIALSDDESDVKAMAISLIDWSNDLNSLKELIYKNDNNSINIREAIINAGNSLKNNSDRNQFDQLLLNKLNQESNQEIIISTVAYLKTKNIFLAEKAISIANSMTQFPDVIKYMENQ